MRARVPERLAFKGYAFLARGYTSASACNGIGKEQTGVSRSSMRAQDPERPASKLSRRTEQEGAFYRKEMLSVQRKYE
ncbi:hypothetical protein NDU88_005242 [Pleurodeles waltl]|uniref:Uncharacterized protein n=1 Tax=Pleurodeles waltl TaxID=8319 RepID=A0AAV7QE50_PLEWA|nr:hypothetical protein NDU88_005242 [Pleurodeles waltl]